MLKMIDAHIHLTSDKYDTSSILQEAKENGVIQMLVIGCDEKEIIKSLELVKKNSGYLLLAIGFHPMEASKITVEKLKWLENLCQQYEEIVAIGEIGLDYHWYPEEKEIQKKWFKKQINIAKKLKKPLIIHARESYDDCYDMLEQENYFYGIMHSFADDYQSAKRFLEKGMYISISGPVTFKNGHNQKEVVRNIPIDKLLVETDGPFLTPEPYRGQLNKPMYLEYIIKEIAHLKDIPMSQVEEALINNMNDFLGGI